MEYGFVTKALYPPYPFLSTASVCYTAVFPQFIFKWNVGLAQQ